MIPYIDARVKVTGASTLRTMSAKRLRHLGDELYVFRYADRPVAVLLSYEAYMALQAAAGITSPFALPSTSEKV